MKRQRTRWRVVAEGFDPDNRNFREVAILNTSEAARTEKENYEDRQGYRMKSVTIDTIVDEVEEGKTA